MISRLKALLSGLEQPGRADADLRTAVAALLVEAAWTHQGFAPAERDMIERLLSTRFGLSPAEAHELITSGDDAGRDSVHLLRFTRRVLEGMEPQERVAFIEMLWDVAYADGQVDSEEERLIAKIAGLIFVSPSERSAARKRALARASTR